MSFVVHKCICGDWTGHKRGPTGIRIAKLQT
jgi:hypothetical protein